MSKDWDRMMGEMSGGRWEGRETSQGKLASHSLKGRDMGTGQRPSEGQQEPRGGDQLRRPGGGRRGKRGVQGEDL